MAIKDHPVAFGVCIGGLLLLIIVVIIILYVTLNRDKKEGFRRTVLNRFIAGGPNKKAGNQCGRQFRGNEVGYLLNKEQLPEDWYKKPINKTFDNEMDKTFDDSDITQEMANKTLNDITEQTGINVAPNAQLPVSSKDMSITEMEINQGPKSQNSYDTSNKINEDRTVETNVGKPVTGPVSESFNHSRISAFNTEPLESLLASSSFGAQTEHYPTNIAMKKYVKENFN